MEQHHEFIIGTGQSEKNLDNLEKRLDSTGESLDKAQESAEGLEEKLDDLQETAGEVQETLGGVGDAIAETSADIAQAGKSMQDALVGAGAAAEGLLDSCQNAQHGATKALETIDESLQRLNASANEKGEMFKQIMSRMTSEGLDIQTLKETVTESEAQLKKLISKYDEVAAHPLVNNAHYTELAKIKKDIYDYANTIAAAKARIQELTEEEEKNKNKTISIRTQIRILTNQLNAMRLAGKENTDEFKKLSDELGRLATAQRETSNAMRMDSTGATQWTGMIEGVQGLMGAYSAASGVIGLFTKDQEKLMQVQTKMQSTMSILMGMQQVANTLHSTSTFRLRTLTAVQAKLNAVTAKYDRALRQVRVALHRVGVSAQAATVAMNALKVATLAIGMGAIVGLSVVITKLVKKFKEQQKAAQEAKEAQEAFNSAVADGASKPIATFMELQAKYSKLADTMAAKKKFIDENAQAFKELGVQVKNVNDLDNLMIENADKYIDAQIAKARADAAREKLLSGVKKSVEIEEQIKNEPEKVEKWVGGTYKNGAVYGSAKEMVDNPALAELKKQGEENREEMNKNLEDMQKYAQEMEELLTSGKFDSSGSGIASAGKISDDAAKAYKQFEDSYIKARDKYDEESLEKELDKIEFRKNLELKALEKAFDEVKKKMTEAGQDTTDLESMYKSQRGYIEDSAMKAAQAYTEGQAEALRQSAEEYAGYYDLRASVEQKYAKEHAKFFNADGTLKAGLENMDGKKIQENLDRDKKASLEAIDEMIADRQAEFEIWCERLADASLLELMNMINEAQAALDLMEEGVTESDGDKIALYSAQIKKAREAMKGAKTDVTMGKRTLQEWKDLNDVLGDCASSFEEMGDAAGGAVGEILSAAGSVASSASTMINGILRLKEVAARSVTETAEAGGAAVQAVEQASIVLTVIKAALKVYNMVRDAVEGNKSANRAAADAEYEYARSIESTNRALEKHRSELIFGADDYGKMISGVKEASSNLKQYESAVKGVEKTQLESNKKLKWLSKMSAFGLLTGNPASKKIEGDFIADMRSGWQKFIGSTKNVVVNNIEDFYDETGKLNADKLRSYYNTYQDSLTDASKASIEKILNEWDDVQEALDGIRDYLTDIFGTLGNEISDALVDAFENGSDAAESFGKSLSSVLEKWTEQMAYSALLQPILTKMQDQVQSVVENTGLSEQQKLEQMMWSLADGMDEILGIQEVYNSYLQQAKDMAAQKGIELWVPDKESLTGSKGGITTASQETVDELNGRATAIQGHTFSIAENTKVLTSQCASILDTLFRIDNNTQRLYSIEESVGQMRAAVTEIRDKGVNIRN